MQFPWSLIKAMTWHALKCRLTGRRRAPIVLMLEPLFACNLRCEGCGRIREYHHVMDQRLSVEECLASAQECDAPIVSICGGEPLLYPELDRLVNGLIAQGRHIYLCTNALLVDRWIDRLPRSSRLTWNIHLDGMEATHDAITQRPGTFQTVIQNIRRLKADGRRVTTNTTIYAQTDMDEILVLLDYLSELRIDGMLLSPAYPYPVVNGQPQRLPTINGQAQLPGRARELGKDHQVASQLFLTRCEVHAKFAAIRKRLEGYRLLNSPLYLDFLCGKREIPCAAWACPTRNICGWKSPCYLLTDTHYPTFAEWQEKTPWHQLGPAQDPRCHDCLVHYGFETGAVVVGDLSLCEGLALVRWQLASPRAA